MSAERKTSQSDIRPLADTAPFSALELFKAPLVVRYLAALMMTALATAVAVGLDNSVTIPNLSALAYNFFLTEPRYTLMVDDPANIWAIALLFVVGCIASAAASTARRRADDLALLQRQATALQIYSRDALVADNTRAVIFDTASALEALFRLPVVVMILSEAAVDVIEKRGKFELLEAELAAGRSSLTTGKVVPASVYPFDTSRFDFWPVATSTGRQAVIGLAFDPDERPLAPSVLVEIVGGILALALDRQHLQT